MPFLLQGRPIRAGVLGLTLAMAGACGSLRSCATPPAPPGRFLYVAHGNAGAGAITTLRIDPATGALTPVGTTASDGGSALAVDPSGRWFAQPGTSSSLLHIGKTGALVRGAEALPPATAAAYDTENRFYFHATTEGLQVRRFDPRDGVSDAAPVAVRPNRNIHAMTAMPGGYLLFDSGELVVGGKVGPAGKLETEHARDLNGTIVQLAAHPRDRVVALVEDARGHRWVAVHHGYTLAPVSGSPFDVAHDGRAIAVAPNGLHVFVADDGQQTIETLAMDDQGTLYPTTSTVSPLDKTALLIVDADGKFLYAAGPAVDAIHGFGIAADGSLTPIPGSPFTVGGGISALAVTPRSEAEGPVHTTWLDTPEAEARARRSAGQPPAPKEPEVVVFTPTSSLDQLIAGLGDADATVRTQAARNLSYHEDLRAAVPHLVAALDDPSDKVQWWARIDLAQYARRNPEALDLDVLDRLINGEHGGGVDWDNTALLLVEALRRRGPDTAEILARVVGQGGRLGRHAAGALMGMQERGAPAVPELRRLLAIRETQRDAINVLATIGPAAAEAVPELSAIAFDEQSRAQYDARQALERIRGRR